MRRGTRSELAFRRRLLILAQLHTRPHSYSEMQTILAAAGFSEPLGDDEPAAAKRRHDDWHADLKVLRGAGYAIRCDDRRTQRYSWTNSPFGLALNERQLLAFGIIRDAFADTTMLHHAEIHDLLTLLMDQLPPEQRAHLSRKRRPYQVNLRETTDYRTADPATVQAIERAIDSGQQLEIRYCSSNDGLERVHTVEPRPLIYKAGHVYLPVYNLILGKELELRLDGIVPGSAKGLPQRAQPSRPPGRRYLLRYHLNPIIARRRPVSENFPGQQVEYHPDGSATVSAQITDLFTGRRLLLAYGENCHVLSPPELIADLRQTIAALHQHYSSAEE
ncbi:MAG: WYL domain-containing protein [Chloroflexota bacterium]|nr:WYL domain-containing protein [Chloroflexota bacterium]